MLSGMIESLRVRSYKYTVAAGFLMSSAIFLLVSLVTFSAYDHSLFYGSAGVDPAGVHNYAGACGAYCAALLLYIYGCAAFLLIPLILVNAMRVVGLVPKKRARQIAAGLTFLILGVSLLSYQMGVDWYAHISPGGLLGMYGTCVGLNVFEVSTFFMLTLFLNGLGILLIIQFAWVRPFIQGIYTCAVLLRLNILMKRSAHLCLYPGKKITSLYRQLLNKHIYKKYLERSAQPAEPTFASMVHEHIFDDSFWQTYRNKNSGVKDDLKTVPMEPVACDEHEHADTSPAVVVKEAPPAQRPFIKPLDILFRNVRVTESSAEEEAFIKERARNLESKLALFGIEGNVVSITAGPVVTLFEYSPARDVKISKIVLLEDDLALALEAHSLRIIAPIPGRSVVGFEVANSNRQTVHFAEIAASKGFRNYTGTLPLIVGRDTMGHDIIADLIEMPHLLVAGSTGSGKSVALNAMLTSLLCKVHPDEVRLILIDPKRLEFAAFADIPHLIFPIITEVARVPQVLSWAVKIMEERYAELARVGVRHVSEYHKKYGVAAMPYTVIVIDELADLMMAARSGATGFAGSRSLDIEGLIARLAQMSRAAGIHLIIATQRPSVDVITGLIKVNFPSRIACKVISKVDSRTILDQSGAEKLLGKGDMLFLNHKGVLARVHGAYVRDDEISEVVSYVKSQQDVVYQELETISSSSSDDLVSEEDPLYSDVCAYVTTMSEISISLLQRKFRIGYNRSARLIDTLEARGIVLPAHGGKFRKVVAGKSE